MFSENTHRQTDGQTQTEHNPSPSGTFHEQKMSVSENEYYCEPE